MTSKYGVQGRMRWWRIQFRLWLQRVLRDPLINIYCSTWMLVVTRLNFGKAMMAGIIIHNRTLTFGVCGEFCGERYIASDVYTTGLITFIFKQLFNFIKPGFKRVTSTKIPEMTLLAFYNPQNGNIVITRKNDSEASDSGSILKTFRHHRR